MTIAAPRATLTLKRRVSPSESQAQAKAATPAPAPAPAPVRIKFAALNVLMAQHWPQLFGTTEIRPLALGTYADIVADVARRGLGLDAKLDIRRYLGIYCSQKGYLKALTNGGPRYTLSGEKKGEVTAEDIDAARLKLSAYKGKAA